MTDFVFFSFLKAKFKLSSNDSPYHYKLSHLKISSWTGLSSFWKLYLLLFGMLVAHFWHWMASPSKQKFPSLL